ncbi:MAG: xanthine dehydrogenase family protein molybdopterin-binding subunit [Actinomycetia bacterium]|nr:xanthine dehydrogenase family protein molybdopterin-binding subunit [Actinomycetes bacterium]
MSIADDPATDAPGYKWVGSRPIRPDGFDKVTGRAKFGADHYLPGMLEGHTVRSPHAHARIVSIDTSAAERVPGVKAVVTGADFPAVEGDAMARNVPHNSIARDKVLYEGHLVAAVAATSREAAKAGAEAVVVEYEVLPHVLTAAEATAEGAPLLHDDMITNGIDPAPEQPSNIYQRNILARGDLDKGFADADVVVEREFITKPVHQGYIEPQACVADTTPDGHTTLWVSSQGHFAMRDFSAQVLGWDITRVKAIAAEIGGGFGGKTVTYLEPIAIKLSAKAGRPVKMVMTRAEVLKATGPTSGSRMRVKMGARGDGKFTAAEIVLEFEAGGYPGSPVMPAAMTCLAPYDLENFSVEGFDIVVNKPRSAAYRAPGGPISSFAVESVVDMVAEELGMDPIDLRLTNAAVEGTQAPYGPKLPRIGMVETLEAVRDHPHYSAQLGPNQGRGVATGFWFNAGMNSSVVVHVNPDGTATVVTGSPDIGGSRASMALFAAEELGIDMELIRPVVADTETVGFNDVTGGSRVTHATGAAVVEACRLIVADLRARAAKTWDVDIDEVEWVDGQAQKTDGSEAPLSLKDIAGKWDRSGGPISAAFTHNARGAGPAFSTQVCDVEVDPDTGVVTVVRYTTAQDAGRAIHPSYVEGQFQGGVVQGIGWALNEEYVYGDDGRLQNASFLDYRIPVTSDMPMIDTVLVEVPNPAHPYGVRGVGEVGIVPPLAAVANAVYQATGKRFTELPINPIRILEATMGE